VGLIKLSPSVSQLSRKYGTLDVSQLYGTPWAVTGIALPFYTDSFCNFVDRFTALRFTATGVPPAARRI
jgi:hypothetical protein